jgi:hypothetical protein
MNPAVRGTTILLFTEDSNSAEAVIHGGDPAFDTRLAFWSQDWPDRVATIVADPSLTAIVVDAHFDPDDERLLSTLQQMRLSELRQTLQRRESVPSSVKLLPLLRVNDEAKHLPLFIAIDNPSVALSQELLRVGADWVWPHRNIGGEGFTAILSELARSRKVERRLDDAAIGKRPPILAVEDARAEWNRISVELRGICRVEFVGEERPATRFRIEPEEVIAVVGAKPYQAAIVDLALNVDAESVAREHFMNDEDAIAWIRDRGGIDGNQLVSAMFGGIEVVRLLRTVAPGIPICILSNYARHAGTVDVLNYLLRNEMQGLVILEKSEEDYDELRKWAMSVYEPVGEDAGDSNDDRAR